MRNAAGASARNYRLTMESQGKYDFAVFGEGLAGWISALLLAKQGERVLIIPEKRDRREFTGRILFGLEPGGILLRMLQRWGISSSILNRHSKARMECLTPDSSLWIQGSLDDQELGSPGFELGGSNYEKLLSVVRTMEKSSDWKSDFERELVERIRLTTDKRLNRVPFLPDTARAWRGVIRKVLHRQAKGIRIPTPKSKEDSTGRLLRGLGHLLYREESWTEKTPSPLQVAADLFALRNAYFSDEIFKSLKDEFRRVLIATGVEFLPDTVYPEFKRDSSGNWEGFYDNGKKTFSNFQFDHLIFARSLGVNSLNRFEVESQKVLLPDFEAKEFDRYELEVRFKENPFPFTEPAELVSRSLSGGWVRLSIYQTPETSVRVGAWIPVNALNSKGDAKLIAERRLLREIKESLPGLAIDEATSNITTEVHREKRFKSGIGVKGSGPRIWHAHGQSYPQLGEYSPMIACIQIGPIRALTTHPP